jgi:hypothetical protein
MKPSERAAVGRLLSVRRPRLTEHGIVYLFIDGIAQWLRPCQLREPMFAPGIVRGGREVLLHQMAGSREDVETVRAFSQNVQERGLKDPLLVVTRVRP